MELFEKKADKKRRMLAAAYECFTEDSVWDTTINDICNKAGVAKGTFYLYFNGKQEIYEMLIDYCSSYVLTRIFDKIHDVDYSSEEELMITILNELIDLAQSMDKMFLLVGSRLKWPLLTEESVFIGKMASVLSADSSEEQKQETLRTMHDILYYYSVLIDKALSLNDPAVMEMCRADLIRYTRRLLSNVTAH